MFLPSHYIYLVDKDGNASNCEASDCSTIKDFKEEVKDLIEYYSKHEDVSKYIKAQYRNKDFKILYEVSIEECMN